MSKWAEGLNRGTFVISLAIGAYKIDSAYKKDKLELEKKGSSSSGIVAVPLGLPILAILGTSIIVGGAVGWALSEAGDTGIELIQETKGSTIINDYPLYKYPEGH